MNVYDIALALALSLSATVIAARIPSRGFAWRYRDARLPLLAQTAMMIALVLGLVFVEDGRQPGALVAGWLIGTLVGGFISMFRSPSEPKVEATTSVAG